MRAHIERRGNGPPLALLHGWGSNAAVWAGLEAELAQRHTLYLVDLPGHGQAPVPSPMTLREFAAELAHSLPAGAHLCGWSLGAMLTMQMALEPGSNQRKLVLIAGSPCWVASNDWPHALAAKTLTDFEARLRADASATLIDFLALQVLHSAHRPATLKALQAPLAARGAPTPAGLALGWSWLIETDLRPQLAKLECPVLIVHGDRDSVAPIGAAHWLADTLPNARLLALERCGHAPFLSHRDAVTAAINDFLLPT